MCYNILRQVYYKVSYYKLLFHSHKYLQKLIANFGDMCYKRVCILKEICNKTGPMLQPIVTNTSQTKGSANIYDSYIVNKAITTFWRKYFTKKVLKILHMNEFQRKALRIPEEKYQKKGITISRFYKLKVSQNKVLNITVSRDN